MSDDKFKGLLEILCEALVEQAKDPHLWARDEFNHGRLSMLHGILLALDSDTKALLINKADIGLGRFDVNEWFRLGRDYHWSVGT